MHEQGELGIQGRITKKIKYENYKNYLITVLYYFRN